MRTLKERTNASIMFITHDLAVIASFADRVMVMYAGVAVESATVRDLFQKPLHPYTQGLLSSVPVLGVTKTKEDGTRNALNIIPGTLPDPRSFPEGCRFAPRCAHIMEKCRAREPGLRAMDEGHEVRCYLYHD
jgi:oligopeptide/dipeptide ABC transporter ATP-binding protein